MTFWFADAHSCLPVRHDSDIHQLRRHYDAGVRYVSINIGMDMNPLSQIMTTIAGFRAQLKQSALAERAETYADIERIVAAGKIAVSFDLEGGIPLLECPDMVEVYHALGVRQIHLAYNRNNALSGGAHDPIRQGLTKLGEQVVDKIHECGILMDLSHSDEKSALDICAHSGNRPVLFSHANPTAVVPHGRNITDRAAKACAQTGGIIGVNGVARFVGDPDLSPLSLVPMIDHLVQLVGAEHVGVGLDYCYDDGIADIPADCNRQYWWPPEAGYDPIKGLSGKYTAPEAFGVLYEALEKRGYPQTAIHGILRDNLLNLIQRVWK